MQPESTLIPCCTRTTQRQTVGAAFGAFVAFPAEPPEAPPPGPEEPPEGLYPLTFWMDGHPVASDWFDPGVAKNIRESQFLATPVELVLIATPPQAHPGWVRVDVSAVATSQPQLQHLLDLLYTRHAAPLNHVGRGRPGLRLGHHWGRCIDAPRWIHPADDETWDVFGRYCNEFFDRILYGDDPQAASRFLDSIPGIRGERPDADR